MPRQISPKSRIPRLTWVFPVIFLVAIAAVYFTGGSRVTEELFKKRLAEAFGVSLTQLEKLSFRLPWGLKPASYELLKSPPHKHPEPAFSVSDSGTGLVFSHLGDGKIPGTSWRLQTTIELLNDNFFDDGRSIEGEIEFYDDNGESLVLTLNGVTGSVFPFQLEAGELKRFVTSGTGAVKTGWAHVHSSQQIGGAASFGMWDSANRLVTDVGVAESSLGDEFTIFADSIGESRTGLAVSNPHETESILLNFRLTDPAGDELATRQRSLPPLGHLGIFLDELFSGVSGINEMEGTVVITSSREEDASVAASFESAEDRPDFGGITLRSTGNLLTSLPMVPPPPTDSEITNLAFPHVGVGAFGNLNLTTSVILFNNTPQPASGVLEFINSDATPMDVTIAGTTDSSFNFQIASGGVVRMKASGAQQGVGWARVTMDRHLGGSAMFQFTDRAAGGALVTEVGVGATRLYQRLQLIANTQGFFNTGLAIATPISDGVVGEETSLNAFLYGNDGEYLARTEIKVPRRGHTSLFVTELFPDVLGVDIKEFDGYVQVLSGEFMAPLVLRSAGAKLTSTPTLRARLNRFAPESTVEFAQTLKGTSPAVHWLLHQNDNDFAIESVSISAPGLGLDPEGFREGQALARGYITQGTNTRMFELIGRDRETLEFDAVIMESDGTVMQGTGQMEGTPTGGLSVNIDLLGKEPYTELSNDADQHYYFYPGLIVIPASKDNATVTTEFTSVSSRPNENKPIIRRITQDISFESPDSSAASLESIWPLFPTPSQLAILKGSDFGEEPLVLFSLPEGEAESVLGQVTDDGDIEVLVPSTVVDGPILVDNGNGPGNGCLAKMLFAPRFEAGLIPIQEQQSVSLQQNGGFFFRFEQTPDQFLMADFVVEIYGLEVDLESLEVDDVVGSGTLVIGFDERKFDMKVESVDEEGAILRLVYAVYGHSLELAIGVEATEEGGVRFTWLPDQPEEEVSILDQFTHLMLELDFTAFPAVLPSEDQIVVAFASLTSTPTEPLLKESVSRVYVGSRIN